MILLSVDTEFNNQQNFSTSTEFFFFPFVLQPAETVIVHIWLVSGSRQTPNRKAHVWDERSKHSLHKAEEPFNPFLHSSSGVSGGKSEWGGEASFNFEDTVVLSEPQAVQN